MSIDLFIARAPSPLTLPEVERALAALSEAIDGLRFFSLRDDSFGPTAYFSNVGRVELGFVVPAEEDIAEEEEELLRLPFAVVSSRSGAWPWIEFTAMELAKKLNAKIYDPQEGQVLESLTPEHDIDQLRALHEEDLAERNPILSSTYWAFQKSDDDKTLANSLVQHIQASALDVLKIGNVPAVDGKLGYWSHSFSMPGGISIEVSTSAGYLPTEPRSVNVSGPTSCTSLHAFANAIAQRAGIAFRKVDEYK